MTKMKLMTKKWRLVKQVREKANQLNIKRLSLRKQAETNIYKRSVKKETNDSSLKRKMSKK